MYARNPVSGAIANNPLVLREPKRLRVRIDRTLYDLLAAGDEWAFKAIYDAYWHAVHCTAFTYLKSSSLAEDVVQETFVRVWKYRRKFTRLDNPEAYLHMIARNRIKTAFRHLRPYESLHESIAAEALTAASSAQATELRQLEDLIYKTVELLPPQQAQVFRMSRFQHLSYDEIGDRLNISPATVRNHLVKALSFMRQYFASRRTDLGLILLMATLVFFQSDSPFGG